jgi:hypothetical protein
MANKNSYLVDKRVRKIKDHPYNEGPVIYWMSRDQRAHDN